MDVQHDTDEEQRRKYVAHINEALAPGNVFPNAEDFAIQARYVAGSARLEELLDSAHVRVAWAERHRRQAAMDFARASVAVSGFRVSEDFEKQALQTVRSVLTLEEFLRKN